jgi:hypothetical protein
VILSYGLGGMRDDFDQAVIDLTRFVQLALAELHCWSDPAG